MTVEKLRETIHQKPFRPFTIRLADGDAVTIRHPEHLALSPTGRTVIVYKDDDSYSVIDLLLVTRLDVEGQPQSATGGSQN